MASWRSLMPGAKHRVWLFAAALAVCAAVFAWAVRDYWRFLADDSLISLRYSERLLEGKGLTWNDDLPVEGYSNLLWVLACAGVGAFGVNLVAAARALGLLCVAVTALALIHSFGLRRWRDLLPSTLPPIFLALSGTVLAWSVGGLEQPLLGALLAWAIVLSYPVPAAWTPSSGCRVGGSDSRDELLGFRARGPSGAAAPGSALSAGW